MLSDKLTGYLLIWILCILLGINISKVTYKLNKKYFLIALLGPMVAAIFPYKEASGDLLSNLHEISAYISFFVTILMTYFNIENYKFISIKKANLLKISFSFILLITVILFLNSNGVLGYQETLLLSGVLIINQMMS